MGLIEKNEHMNYWNITLGALRRKANSDDPEAETRTYKDKSGKEKTATEIVKAGVSGMIREVKIQDGKYGKQFVVYIDDVEQFAVQMPWDSPYARSICEKLGNVNPSKEVELIPYSFTPKDKTKPISGVTIIQDGLKLQHYFKEFDMDGNFSGWKDGYPHFTEGMESEDFKIVGAQQQKFLKENVVEKFPFFEGTTEEANDDKPKADDDLPF